MKNRIVLLVLVLLITLGILSFFLLTKENQPKIQLSDSEKLYLKSIEPIKIAVDPDWEPFEKLNSNGTYNGIAADYLKLIEKKLDVKIQIIPTSDWDQSITYSKEGKVTLLSFLNPSEERKKWLVFTEPIFVDDNVWIVNTFLYLEFIALRICLKK